MTIFCKPASRGGLSNRLAIYDKTLGCCFYCGTLLPIDKQARGYSGLKFVVEHIISGLEEWANLVPACGSCNNRKCNRTLADFRKVCPTDHSPVPIFTDRQRRYLATLGVFPPRVTRVKLWFETRTGRSVLMNTHDPCDLERLDEILATAENGRAQEAA